MVPRRPQPSLAKSQWASAAAPSKPVPSAPKALSRSGRTSSDNQGRGDSLSQTSNNKSNVVTRNFDSSETTSAAAAAALPQQPLPTASLLTRAAQTMSPPQPSSTNLLASSGSTIDRLEPFHSAAAKRGVSPVPSPSTSSRAHPLPTVSLATSRQNSPTLPRQNVGQTPNPSTSSSTAVAENNIQFDSTKRI